MSENNLTDLITEFKALDTKQGGTNQDDDIRWGQLCHELTPLLIDENTRLEGWTNDVLRQLDERDDIIKELQSKLADEKAGRLLLAKATDKIAQLENELAALKSGMYLQTLQLANDQMAKTIDILRNELARLKKVTP
jgi:hypothetical protein